MADRHFPVVSNLPDPDPGEPRPTKSLAEYAAETAAKENTSGAGGCPRCGCCDIRRVSGRLVCRHCGQPRRVP
jgi:hypothetical protein